jgi:hypothetical protein
MANSLNQHPITNIIIETVDQNTASFDKNCWCFPWWDCWTGVEACDEGYWEKDYVHRVVCRKEMENKKDMLMKLDKLRIDGFLYTSHRRVILKEYL